MSTFGATGPNVGPLTFIAMARCMCSKTTSATYVLALTPLRRFDKMVAVAPRLVEHGKTDWLEVRRLYLIWGFDNNGVVAYLIAVY